jgi:hypothetical protein
MNDDDDNNDNKPTSDDSPKEPIKLNVSEGTRENLIYSRRARSRKGPGFIVYAAPTGAVA